MTEYVPPTKRRKMTKARAARIFLQRNGVCFICEKQIRAGEAYFIEHPIPVAMGGSDKDEDLWPAHNECKPKKDAIDAKAKAKSDRILTQNWDNGSRSKLQGRGFSKPPKQRKATKPIEPKFDGDILSKQPEKVT